MSKTELLSDEFQTPAGFDLKTYWKASTAELMAGGRGYLAVLNLSAEAAAEFGRWRPVRRVSLPANSAPLPEAWATFSVDFDDEQQALFCVLGLGSHVIVVEPAGLQQRVSEEVRGAMERLQGERGR